MYQYTLAVCPLHGSVESFTQQSCSNGQFVRRPESRGLHYCRWGVSGQSEILFSRGCSRGLGCVAHHRRRVLVQKRTPISLFHLCERCTNVRICIMTGSEELRLWGKDGRKRKVRLQRPQWEHAVFSAEWCVARERADHKLWPP